MNARVFLLVLMTGLFMVIWNGDQTAMQAALARRAHAQEQMLADRALARPTSTAELRQSAGSAAPAPSALPAPTAVRAISANSIPLPPGLPPGDYHAVSQTGQSLRVSIEENSASPADTTQPAELFISDSHNGTRWFFVRINSDTRL